MQTTATAAIDTLIDRELPAARAGDRIAYGRIVAACQNTVTAVALAITRDVPASEDIAQDAFLSAWQHIKRLQNPASFLPWLRQITRNLARDHLRAARHRPLDGEGAELAIELAADTSPTPSEWMEDDEREREQARRLLLHRSSCPGPTSPRSPSSFILICSPLREMRRSRAALVTFCPVRASARWISSRSTRTVASFTASFRPELEASANSPSRPVDSS